MTQAELIRLTQEVTTSVARRSDQSFREHADRSQVLVPELMSRAAEGAVGAAGVLQDFMRSSYESALDWAYPQWRDTIADAAEAHRDVADVARSFRDDVLPNAMLAANQLSTQALANVGSMMAGEMPDAAREALQRQSAELAMQMGVRGQAARYMADDNMQGRILETIAMGHQLAPQALAMAPQAYAGFAETLGMPMQSAAQMTSILGQYRPDTIDPSGLYGQAFGALAQSTMLPATTAFGAPLQQTALGLQAGQAAAGLSQWQQQFAEGQRQFDAGSQFQQQQFGAQQYWQQQSADYQRYWDQKNFGQMQDTAPQLLGRT